MKTNFIKEFWLSTGIAVIFVLLIGILIALSLYQREKKTHKTLIERVGEKARDIKNEFDKGYQTDSVE